MKHMSQIKLKQITPKESLENLESRFIELSLGDIELNSILQARVDMKPTTVKDYEKAFTNKVIFPPLLVAEITDYKGDSAYLLLDGWHRRQALLNINWQELIKVKALKIPKGTTIEQLIYLGGRENLTNGLPLTSKDKRALFKAYIKGGFNRNGRLYKSYREIAKDLNTVTYQTIHIWMGQDFPSIANRMRKQNAEDSEPISYASGTGHLLTVMPDLSNKELGLIALDIITFAKGSDNGGRENIAKWLKELDIALRWEAPFTTTNQSISTINKVNLLTLSDDTFNKI